MSPPVRVAICILVAAFLAIGARQAVPKTTIVSGRPNDGGATYRLDRASADRAGAQLLDAPTRAATISFAAGTSAQAQSYFLGAVASARPEARSLINLVDGLVTVHFGPVPRANAIGLTSYNGKRFDVTIDIDRLLANHGVGALNATILHELGHVVDQALVPDTLVAELDAKIPTGINCIPGQPTGACAPIEERFADTFARWAMDDISINGTVGYRILPPVPIATWGRPLAQLVPAS